MDIQVTIHLNKCVVAVIGSIDAGTAGVVTDTLCEQISQNHPQVVLDLSQVDFMSSAGLGSILEALKESRQAGGDLRIAAAQPGIARVLEISGFTNILQSFKSVEKALASYDQ